MVRRAATAPGARCVAARVVAAYICVFRVSLSVCLSACLPACLSLYLDFDGDLQSCHNSPTHRPSGLVQENLHCQEHCNTVFYPHCRHVRQSQFPTAVVLGFPSVCFVFPSLLLSLSVRSHCLAVVSPVLLTSVTLFLSQFLQFHQQLSRAQCTSLPLRSLTISAARLSLNHSSRSLQLRCIV